MYFPETVYLIWLSYAIKYKYDLVDSVWLSPKKETNAFINIQFLFLLKFK